MTLEYKLTELISAQEIAERNQALAQALSDVIDESWVAVALMDGAFVFAGDLMRALCGFGINPDFDNLTLSSYGDDIQSAGEVKVEKGFSKDLSGKNVIILDDVFETGLTLSVAKAMAMEAGARDVKTCVFAYKASYVEETAQPDFKAWDAPNAFLVGYGMDFKGRYRGLPFIADLLS